MVTLNRIYTRTGDDGGSTLATGERRPKSDQRFVAIGTVDEVNATVGLARLAADGAMDAMLARIQNDLFDLGADLAVPEVEKRPRERLRIIAGQVERLEGEIDAMNEGLAPLTSFVLPGGTPLAAGLHLCRTVTRRAEREMVALAATQLEHAGFLIEKEQTLVALKSYQDVLATVANVTMKEAADLRGAAHLGFGAYVDDPKVALHLGDHRLPLTGFIGPQDRDRWRKHVAVERVGAVQCLDESIEHGVVHVGFPCRAACLSTIETCRSLNRSDPSGFLYSPDVRFLPSAAALPSWVRFICAMLPSSVASIAFASFSKPKRSA